MQSKHPRLSISFQWSQLWWKLVKVWWKFWLWWKQWFLHFVNEATDISQALGLEAKREDGSKTMSLKNMSSFPVSNHPEISCWRQIIKLWAHCPLINYNIRISPNDRNIIFLQEKGHWHLLRYFQGTDKSAGMSYCLIFYLLGFYV